MALSGLAVAYTAVGGIILWSGIKGETLTQTFQDVLSGKAPTQNTQKIGTPTLSVGNSSSSGSGTSTGTAGAASVGAASGGPVTANTVTSIQNYNLARMVAATYGWASGQEWASFTELINSESGGRADALNPTSGAYGITQALGHGTANTRGTVTNEYGGYGVPDGTCVGANSGNATDQLIWMCAYVKTAYGDPIKAWSFHVRNNYY